MRCVLPSLAVTFTGFAVITCHSYPVEFDQFNPSNSKGLSVSISIRLVLRIVIGIKNRSLIGRFICLTLTEVMHSARTAPFHRVFDSVII